MKDIIILGTGGNAIDIAEAVEANRRNGANYRILGFLDDNPSQWGTKVANWPVLGALASARQYPTAEFVNGIGSPTNFWKKPSILARTGLAPEKYTNVIHPTAWVSPSARLGRGVALLAHVSICAQAEIGDHVIVLPNSVISHDDVIGNYTCITSGVCISGSVKIGCCCYVGTNSAIRGYTQIGERVLIGMGSVVLSDVPDNQIIVGSPARFLRPTVPGAAAA
jgi:sugar O-acyltransferase (sialic acid O-acetyltransferase NeuD family)